MLKKSETMLPKVRRTDDAKRVNRLPVFGMSKNMELLELIHNIVVAHALENLEF